MPSCSAPGGWASAYRRPFPAEIWNETRDDRGPDFQMFVEQGILTMVKDTC